MSNKGKNPEKGNALRRKSLELLLAMMIMQGTAKPAKSAAKKPVQAKKQGEKKPEGIEARVKEKKPAMQAVSVSYGDPLQEIAALDHAGMFSYLNSRAAKPEYREDAYGDRVASVEAASRTIDVRKAYSLIKSKKNEDMAYGGCSWSHTLDKDYRSFQYWKLFNNALNIVLYAISGSTDMGTAASSAANPSQ